MKTMFSYKKRILPVLISAFFIPTLALAQSPLVPCGGPGQPDCELCHLFVMFNNIVGFVLYSLVPPIAVMMLIIGGLLFYFSAGDDKKITTARNLIQSTIMGLLFVYLAWSIVILVFTVAGAAQWDNWWYTISC